jgi:hypothetical protein
VNVTLGTFPRGTTVRHKDTEIVGHVIEGFRHHDPESGQDGRDYVRVKWSGGGIVTDEPLTTIEIHEVLA